MADRDEATCVCAGWVRPYGIGEPGEKHHRDCQHWRREHQGTEVIQTRTELIVLGTPDDGDEAHNCDVMGCGSFSHVLFRLPLADGVTAPLRQSESPADADGAGREANG